MCEFNCPGVLPTSNDDDDDDHACDNNNSGHGNSGNDDCGCAVRGGQRKTLDGDHKLSPLQSLIN